MKVKEMKSILESNKFDNIECNFKLKSKGPNIPEWFKKFHDEEFKPLQKAVVDLSNKLQKWLLEFEQRINNRFDQLESRIDNLVTKNNLKE